MLLKIDELVIGDHHYLTSSDECFYYKEYTKGAGFSTPGNDLVVNFKHSVVYRGTARWPHKLGAIRRVANLFGDTLTGMFNLNEVTLVPIPPSKAKSNPLYDDRMIQALTLLGQRFPADIRELIVLRNDMQASHSTTSRADPNTIQENLFIDETKLKGARNTIVLLDDVITTGAHFIACKNIITEALPSSRVLGIFVARRALPSAAEDFGFDFENL